MGNPTNLRHILTRSQGGDRMSTSMPVRASLSIFGLVLLAAWAGSVTIPPDSAQSCRVTRPPSPPFAPPSPYPAKPGQGSFWFGTEKLWVLLPADGTWQGLKPYSREVPGYRQKIFWQSVGYNWRWDGGRWHVPPTPLLTVTGRRLGSDAPPLPSRTASNGCCFENNTAFLVAGVDFPTHGCWEVTGRINDDKLTFVVLIAP